jgi:pyruvate kinase
MAERRRCNKLVIIQQYKFDIFFMMGMPQPFFQSDHDLALLLDDVVRLREQVLLGAEQRLREYPPRDGCTHSASMQNLARYLAMRRVDLRPLQERLANAGLSSLGRSESHVLANLNGIIELLSRAVGAPVPPLPHADDVCSGSNGAQILQQRTRDLFGPRPEERDTRIMVTLPTQAAQDYGLIRGLMAEGMNCVRINCAHDDAEVWQGMIQQLRRAERELGTTCKILMDLAGHKIRTGPVAVGAAVMHVRPVRDAWGRVSGPAKVVLLADAAGAGEETPADALYIPQSLYPRLQVGDRLTFDDCRGKRRHLDIAERRPDGSLMALANKSAFVGPQTRVRWRRSTKRHYADCGEFRFQRIAGWPLAIRLFEGDTLLLTREPQPGGPAAHDEQGRITAPAHIACSLPQVLDQLQTGQSVWFDDGKIGTAVDAITDKGAVLRVTHSRPRGICLRAEKGMNFPDAELRLPALSDKDLGDLDFVCANADMVGFSFVQTKDDMAALMDVMQRRGASHLPIIAKIETRAAVKNLPELIFTALDRHPLGVMIARGDLAVELGSVRLAEIQEEILWLCEAAQVPVIWATQVLESIAKKGVRSRAEFTDAAMSVRAECVMLNKGPYIVQALRALGHVLVRMQDHQFKKVSRMRALHW